MRSPGSQSKQAFSLVEVSLALAIIGIAFTVIIGMLPVGLRQARSATDTTNEARILSSMTAILGSTEYANIPLLEKKIHYFDADGGFLEIEGGGDKYITARVYEALFLISDQPRPGNEGSYDRPSQTSRIHIVYGRTSDATKAIFAKIAGGEFSPADIKRNSPVRVTPVVIAKMDNKNL